MGSVVQPSFAMEDLVYHDMVLMILLALAPDKYLIALLIKSNQNHLFHSLDTTHIEQDVEFDDCLDLVS